MVSDGGGGGGGGGSGGDHKGNEQTPSSRFLRVVGGGGGREHIVTGAWENIIKPISEYHGWRSAPHAHRRDPLPLGVSVRGTPE